MLGMLASTVLGVAYLRRLILGVEEELRPRKHG